MSVFTRTCRKHIPDWIGVRITYGKLVDPIIANERDCVAI